MQPAAPLPPGSTIGILGGGQLGRMLCLAAARLGMRGHVFCPQAEAPAMRVAAARTVAPYGDAAALTAFASSVDVVTYEFENVPVEAAWALDARVPVRPSPDALAVTQDRLDEKRFLRESGIAAAPFAAVSDLAGLEAAVGDVNVPAVLKTRRFGYDGKGQVLLRRTADAERAWAAIGGAEAIVEAFVDFDCEISVIAARGLDGVVACYDPVRNVHENHILARSIVPAGLEPDVAAEATNIAGRIVGLLDYVGVIGVEMFVARVPGGASGRRILVNELAPRVHNSGHWTADACTVSQFEQHVRAICGWPLGSCRRHSDAVMQNLLGSDVDTWPDLASMSDTAVHLYDKGDARPGRKMGHVTRLASLGTISDG